MTNLTGKERAQYVQSMFTRIAHRYDFMNRLMTGAQDVCWRKQVIQLAQMKPSASLLDLGAGTGDLAREALKQNPQAHITAADFTLEMIRVGRKPNDPPYSAADALNLPFKDSSFDAIVSGFLMRNVTDVNHTLKEQCRVLKSGGQNRYSRYHASKEKYFVIFHLASHACDHSATRNVNRRHQRCVSISS